MLSCRQSRGFAALTRTNAVGALLIFAALGCTNSRSGASGSDASVPDAQPDAAVSTPDASPPRDAQAPPPRYASLSISCWVPPNSFCNPADNSGCAADEACDVATDENGQPIVTCFPPPAEQGLGQPCSNDRGPFCAGGLRCMDGQCMDTCCENSECAAPLRCVPLDSRLGSLGVCSDAPPMPACARPGAFCAQSSDCCSNDCHIGHCH